MTSSPRPLWAAASICGAAGVAAGAFGAHALRAALAPDLLTIFETAARYQMYHALGALLAAGALAAWRSQLAAAAGWLFIVGIVIFSGSLYLLALTGTRWLGAITPIGGVAFIAAWCCLGAAGWRSLREPVGAASHAAYEPPRTV